MTVSHHPFAVHILRFNSNQYKNTLEFCSKNVIVLIPFGCFEGAVSGVERELERWECLVGQANELLIKTGALEVCPFHKDILINRDDGDAEQKAYDIGTNMFEEGRIDGSREEFMKAIKETIEQSYDECPCCHRHMKD